MIILMNVSVSILIVLMFLSHGYNIVCTSRCEIKQTLAETSSKIIVLDSVFNFIMEDLTLSTTTSEANLKKLEKSNLSRLFSKAVTDVNYYKKGEAVTLKNFKDRGYSATALPSYLIDWSKSERASNKVTYHLSVDPFYLFVIVKKGDQIIDFVDAIKEKKWHVLSSSADNPSMQTPMPKALMAAKQLGNVVFTISYRNKKYPYPHFAFGIKVINKVMVVPFAYNGSAQSYDISDWFKQYRITNWDDRQ